MIIDLESSLKIIRRIQPLVMESGYYLALAGGVLNKGYSCTDLDLVAVPRVGISQKVELIATFIQEGFTLKGDSYINYEDTGMDIYTLLSPEGVPIDIAIVRHVAI